MYISLCVNKSYNNNKYGILCFRPIIHNPLLFINWIWISYRKLTTTLELK